MKINKTTTLGDIIFRHWSLRRFNYGMTWVEIKKLLKELKVSTKLYKQKFGINTQALDEPTGEVLSYRIDIETALECCLENREKTFVEWD